MRTQVVIIFELEGIHNWPEAKDVYPDVAFLSSPHRHMFHFKLYKQVFHDDRDVEFIRWKREVVDYLRTGFGTTKSLQVLEFGRMSCEQIAMELLGAFKCTRVEVWEDGENGAIVEV